MQLRASCRKGFLSFGLGLDDFATTVKPGGADVVAQVHFTRGRLDRDAGYDQGIVRTVHATLRG